MTLQRVYCFLDPAGRGLSLLAYNVQPCKTDRIVMSSPAEEMRRDVSSIEDQCSYRFTGGDQETSTT